MRRWKWGYRYRLAPLRFPIIIEIEIFFKKTRSSCELDPWFPQSLTVIKEPKGSFSSPPPKKKDSSRKPFFENHLLKRARLPIASPSPDIRVKSKKGVCKSGKLVAARGEKKEKITQAPLCTAAAAARQTPRRSNFCSGISYYSSPAPLPPPKKKRREKLLPLLFRKRRRLFLWLAGDTASPPGTRWI